MMKNKALVKRREKITDIIKKTDKGIYVISPYLMKKDGTILFKLGVGFEQGVIARVHSYQTPFPHGCNIIAYIVPNDNKNKKHIYANEQFYFKKFEDAGFQRSHEKLEGYWENRKERGEWFRGKYKDLIKLLFKIEKDSIDNKDSEFKI